MEGFTEKKLSTILYVSLAIIILYLLYTNIAFPWLVLALSGVFTLSLTFRKAVLLESGHKRQWVLMALSVIFDIVCISAVVFFDSGDSAKLLYLILIGDLVITEGSTFFMIIWSSVGCFLGYMMAKTLFYKDSDLVVLLSKLPMELLVMIFFIGIMSVVRHQIIQSVKLKEAMIELKRKGRELQGLNLKLRRNAEELEEMTIVKERNRIAREIHDTVGHTLTTVLVELEAGERLVLIDPEQAVHKLKLSKEQVRKGLNDIRSSVRMLQSGHELVGFEASLKLLMEETMKHAQVNIRYVLDTLPELTENQQKTIYRALQEGLTNGIRHGGSTAFVYRLYSDKAGVRFLLQDNGIGCDKLELGFGLLAMEERVRELGGIFEVRTEQNEGFAINISIPVSSKEE